jgi:hypothetical protein
MRVKKIEVRRTARSTKIIAYGLGERGQTPVINVIEVVDGDFRTMLARPDVQAKLGLRPDRT